MRNQAQPPKRFRKPLQLRSQVLLGLVVVIFAYNAFIALTLLRLPSDNCPIYTADPQGLIVNTAAPQCPLQHGDLVTHINGQPVTHALSTPQHWYRQLFETPDRQGAIYTLQRSGQILEIEVPWHYATPLELLQQIGLLSFISGSLLITAVFILLSRTPEPGAPLLALAFAFLALNLINNSWNNTGVNIFITMTWFQNPLDIITFNLELAIIIHTLLVFPERKWILRRFPKIIWLLYLFNALFIVLGFTQMRGNILLASRINLYTRIFYPMAIIEFTIAIGHLLHTYFTSKRPGVRNQIRWFAWGIIFGLLPWAFLYNVPIILTGQPLISFDVSMIAGFLVPVTFFFSVTRRGLMAIDNIIRRSLIYAGVSLLILAIYLLIIATLEDTLQRVGLGQRLPGILAVLIVALLAAPLRERILRIVDLLFYRQMLDFQSVMLEVARQLSTALRMETLLPLLTVDVPTRLNLTTASLMLCNHHGDLRSITNETVLFPADDPLTAQLRTAEGPLVISGSGPHLLEVQALVEPYGWEVLLPLRRGGQLVGAYALGSKPRGDLYIGAELETLVMLAHQIAATVENVRLYEKVEDYSRGLETIVAERTVDLEAANQDLARERDRLNVILETMADGLLVTDPEGRVLLVNPIFQTMLRRSAEQLQAQPLAEIFDCPELTTNAIQALKHPGEIFSTRCDLFNMIVQAASIALRDGSGVITVLRDITQEVEVDRMKTDFISTVSHELRTPLTSVLGFAKLIGRSFERDIAPQLSEDKPRVQAAAKRIRDNLTIIVQEGERLTRLINDVLDIAKMESGKIEWHDQLFEMNALVQQAVDGVRGMAQGRALALRTELQDNLPPVLGDADRCYQVLVNLLSNAIKFTLEGEVVVSTRLLKPNETPHDWRPPPGSPGGLLLTVRDTGPGIPAAAMPTLFRRFHQVKDETSPERPKGTGLGLAICHEIITHYSGNIWVDSTLGAGSTFSFTLPLPLTPADTPAGKMVVTVPALAEIRRHVEEAFPRMLDAPATVLIVDDETSIRTLLTQELRNAGYQAIEANNGSLALALARQHQPDVIVLDVMMPDISGFDVTRVLKADPLTQDIPILILSILEDRQRGLALGADAYLTKPVKTPTLLSTLHSLLRRAPSMRRALVAGEDETIVTQVATMLRDQNFEVIEIYQQEQVRDAAQALQPDLVVLDETFAQANDNQLLHMLAAQLPELASDIIVVSDKSILT